MTTSRSCEIDLSWKVKRPFGYFIRMQQVIRVKTGMSVLNVVKNNQQVVGSSIDQDPITQGGHRRWDQGGVDVVPS
jgi:hypothetical protein